MITEKANGDLETTSHDLAQLLRRPATSLVQAVRAAYDLLKAQKRRPGE